MPGILKAHQVSIPLACTCSAGAIADCRSSRLRCCCHDFRVLRSGPGQPEQQSRRGAQAASGEAARAQQIAAADASTSTAVSASQPRAARPEQHDAPAGAARAGSVSENAESDSGASAAAMFSNTGAAADCTRGEEEPTIPLLAPTVLTAPNSRRQLRAVAPGVTQAEQLQDFAAGQPPSPQQQQQQHAGAACQDACAEAAASVAAGGSAASNSASGSAADGGLGGECMTMGAAAAAVARPAAQQQPLAERGSPGDITSPAQPRLSYWQQRRAERRGRDSSTSPAASTVASAIWQYRNLQPETSTVATVPDCHKPSRTLAAGSSAVADACSCPAAGRLGAVASVLQQAAEEQHWQRQELCSTSLALQSAVIGPQQRQAVLQELLAERRSRRRLPQQSERPDAEPSAVDGHMGGIPQQESGGAARASPAAAGAAHISASSAKDSAAQLASMASRPAGNAAAVALPPAADPAAGVHDTAADAPRIVVTDSRDSAAPTPEQLLRESGDLEAHTPRAVTLGSDAAGDIL